MKFNKLNWKLQNLKNSGFKKKYKSKIIILSSLQILWQLEKKIYIVRLARSEIFWVAIFALISHAGSTGLSECV